MSTINLHAQGIMPADTYADTITKVRISSDAAFDPEFPWVLDGYNEGTRELSEDVERYRTHADAVTDIPRWLEVNGYTL